jgi:soluble lytic murein transglycosylase-like protein
VTNTPASEAGLASGLLFDFRSPAFDNRTSSSEAHRAANRGPELRMAEDRQRSILEDTPASFSVSNDPNTVGCAPWYANHIVAAEAVRKYDGIIREESVKAGVDPDLVRAIMYTEMAQGHYFGAGPLLDEARKSKFLNDLGIESKTVLPMNVSDVWASLAGNRTDLLDVRQNVRTGTVLLKRIVDRLPLPSVERVATLYNSLAREKVSDYGARVATVYEAKPW